MQSAEHYALLIPGLAPENLPETVRIIREAQEEALAEGRRQHESVIEAERARLHVIPGNSRKPEP